MWICIDIGIVDVIFYKFIGNVIVFGEKLIWYIKSNGICVILCNGRGDFICNYIGDCVLIYWLICYGWVK